MKAIGFVLLLVLFSLGANATGYSENMFVAQKKLNVKKEAPTKSQTVVQEQHMSTGIQLGDAEPKEEKEEGGLFKRGSEKAATLAQYIAKVFVLFVWLGDFLKG
jgi:hypothetical protein